MYVPSDYLPLGVGGVVGEVMGVAEEVDLWVVEVGVVACVAVDCRQYSRPMVCPYTVMYGIVV